MIYSKMTYKAIAALVFVLILAGCSDDIEQGEKFVLNLVPFTSTYADADILSSANTRAVTVPENYQGFSTMYPGDATESENIKVYLAEKTIKNEWLCRDKGVFTYNGTDWISTVFVNPGKQYYLYGIIPASTECNITSTDYSQGAQLTLTGLNALSLVDVCVVTGVCKIENETGNVVPGQFGYLSSPKGGDKLYLLLDHVYARVDFKFAIDEEYNKLRDIKLKKVEVKSASSTFTANVTLSDNQGAPMSCAVENLGGTETTTTLLKETDSEMKLTTSYQSVREFFVPSNIDLVMTCTFDVYDKQGDGNCVRQDCKATNSITISNAKAGNRKTIEMLVQPTYLYQLSEPDLDNPAIVTQTS